MSTGSTVGPRCCRMFFCQLQDVIFAASQLAFDGPKVGHIGLTPTHWASRTRELVANLHQDSTP